MRKLTSLTTAAAVIITSMGMAATPAEARGRHHGWGHRHHDHVDAGDVIGGIFLIGAIAAIASAASKDRPRDRDDRYEPPYRDDPRDDGYYEPEPREEPRPYGGGEAEARAGDACSWAAEGELGDGARVESVTGTEPANGGWYVTGTVAIPDGPTRSFGCTYRDGRVVDVEFR